jgi:alkanesulfonate monooxygenase SsuD/methylene tetrahydromethanopterin reductase-like flavin-dependent oxidoreductase (luciferase family)
MQVDIEFNSAGHIPSPGILEAAPLAEARGFGTLWKGESNSRDPVVVLSSVAARTTRLGLGMAVYHIFARTPVTTGILAATLNELSGGRFILGLGVANPVLAAWHGQSYEKPLRQMREYVDLVRRVYAGEKVEAQGAYFSAQGFKLAFDCVHPLRLYLAALGPQMTRLAGTVADGLIVNMANPAVVREIAEGARAAATEAGRDPAAFTVVAKVRCAINADLAVARAALKSVLTFYALAAGYREMLTHRMGLGAEVQAIHATWRSRGFKDAARQIPDAMLGAVPMVPARSPAEVRAAIQPYFAAGANRVIVAYVPSGPHPIEETLEFVRGWGP